MSGGHYDYQYNSLNSLADDIECDFVNDGSEVIFNGISYTEYLRTKMILEQNTANIYIA
jgi:hypothetical protein